MLTAFGGLKERNLTAVLGFLIAKCPEPLLDLFKIKDKLEEIYIEYAAEKKRVDICIKSITGISIIEAKVDYTNPTKQLSDYKKKIYKDSHKILKLIGISKYNFKQEKSKILYLQWEDIFKCLKGIYENKRVSVQIKFLAKEVMKHMEKHKLVSKTESVEVYSRDINSVKSLNLFFKARLYVCLQKRSSKLAEAKYFAPCFCQKVAQQDNNIQIGISFISKIERIISVEKWKEFIEGIDELPAFRKSEQYISFLKKGWKKNKIKDIVFLGKPYQVFNPSIKKHNLGKGQGRLGYRYFSFDKLFSAHVDRKILK